MLLKRVFEANNCPHPSKRKPSIESRLRLASRRRVVEVEKSDRCQTFLDVVCKFDGRHITERSHCFYSSSAKSNFIFVRLSRLVGYSRLALKLR